MKCHSSGTMFPLKWKRAAIYLTLIALILYAFKLWGGGKVELYYSNTVFPLLSVIDLYIYKIVPFSVGDIFYIGIILWLLFFVAKAIVYLAKRWWNPFGKTVLIIYISTMLLWIVFDLSWGLNYYRKPITQHLGLVKEAIDKDIYFQLIDEYIEIANALRMNIEVDKLDKGAADRELPAIIANERRWDYFLFKDNIHIKHPISSTLISYLMVGGYFNPFTHEAHINSKIPLSSYPFTVAHELSHQMGIGFEDECNFLAFLFLRESSDDWYRYSAYFSVIQYFLRDVKYLDEEKFKSFYNRLSEPVRQDLQYESRFWSRYEGWYSDLSSWFYSLYLKGNNQPEGLARYSEVSNLIYAMELKGWD